MNEIQIDDVRHALKNGNRFYTDIDEPNWNDLVKRGYATKGAGWDEESAYYFVTGAGKKLFAELEG